MNPIQHFKPNSNSPSKINKRSISNKANNILKNIIKIKSRNSIYSEMDKNKTGNKNPRIRKTLILNNRKTQQFQEFNVFENEDKFIKNLMTKFKLMNQPTETPIEKRKKIFNKLYGINPHYKTEWTKVKKKKNLSLEDYQAYTFRVFCKNKIEEQKLFDLAFDLKYIRQQTASISPLPTINFKTIYDHFKTKSVNNKKFYRTKFWDKKKSEDEFEKEEKEIKKMLSYKTIHKGKRNKAFDVLPEFLKTVLSKQKMF